MSRLLYHFWLIILANYISQFIEQYQKLHAHLQMASLSTHKSKTLSLNGLHHQNVDDTDTEDDDDDDVFDNLVDPSRPWLEEWNLYLNTHDIVPEGMGIVCWWGVSLSAPTLPRF